MKNLTDQLAQYASYHRDRRNIATHFFGIPMILFAVLVLVSRPFYLGDGPILLSPALLASLAAAIYYLRLDIPLGLLMSAFLLPQLWLAGVLAQQSTTLWLSWGLGLFVFGWILQSIGHLWEGKKPAFFDDVIGLVIGPLFVVTELVFALGWRRELLAAIEARVGKTRLR